MKNKSTFYIMLFFLILFAIGFFLLVHENSIQRQKIDSALDLSRYYENKCYESEKCFQRIIRYDRYIDYEHNIVTAGYFYNTTWEEVSCGEFEQDKYETTFINKANNGEKDGEV